MLKITAKDYSLLLKTRTALRAAPLPEELMETVKEFCSYVDRLEEEKEADLIRHREALKKWRESPSGKEKNRIINNRGVKNYRARKKAEKAQAAESE